MVEKVGIVETGVTLKIKITVNGIAFYSAKEFETEDEARAFIKSHGLDKGTDMFKPVGGRNGSLAEREARLVSQAMGILE